jgi:hypothetical protein
MAMLEINWKPSQRELRQFAGIWFPAFFALVGYWVFRKTGSLPVAGTIWGVGALASAVAFVVPAVAQRLWVIWMCAAFPIGWTVSHVLMGAIFYLVVTPIGFLLRLAGRDSMGRKFDPDVTTYWVPHRPPEKTESYFRQF